MTGTPDENGIWRTTLDLDGRDAPPVEWVRSGPVGDEKRLGGWRQGVGPVRVAGAAVGEDAGWPLTVVAWNMAVGGGDLEALVWWLGSRDAKEDGGTTVLLLQEAYAAGPPIPKLGPTARWARRIALPDRRMRTEIVSFALGRGMSLCYAPSMRNGGPEEPAEDRGNAILATAPLRGLRVIELPMERQRRVAVAATVEVGGTEVELCSVHLDNRPAWARAWRICGQVQRRQAEGLLGEFPASGGRSPESAPALLGGDFNTWLRGHRQGASRIARARFPLPRKPDLRPTHFFEIGGRLRKSDYLMASGPRGWRFECRRLDATFGSDHFPLVGTLHPDGSSRA